MNKWKIELDNNTYITLHHADARQLPIPDESVDCVVTSPPYWGLRDYGLSAWKGGDENCDHLGKPHSTQAGFNERWTGKGSIIDKQGSLLEPYRSKCGKCGARRVDSGIGLESTPEEYCANMVAVFREVWRVLKPTGTVWLNLGDSYNDKQLVGIPWRVAFALQADGWYLRSDIIWSKPNPMPESVSDRPTKAHEYIFLLTKNARYYYDAEAIQETTGANKRSVWEISTQPYPEAHFATYPEKLVEPCIMEGCPLGGVVLDPFVGSGTTMAVAQRLGRRGIGTDLNEEYLALAAKRLRSISMPMNMGI